jgi:hypothetical protein
VTRIFLLLVPLFAGCGETAAVRPETPPALSDADFDGWRGNASSKQSLDATQAAGILSTILDRVESIEAKLRPPAASVTPTRLESPPRPQPVPEPVGRPLPVAGPSLVAAPPLVPAPPPPAPPAEPLAAVGTDASVETLDIPKGWTGAAVYHAATCPHCPALLAGLKSRASKVSGNYLRVDTPAACWFLLVDWDQRPDVDRPKIQGLPAVLYFIDGHERTSDRVIGFGNRPGELDAVIARHPLYSKRTPVGRAASLPFGSPAYVEWQAGSLPYVYDTVVPAAPAYCGNSLGLFPAQHSAGISLFGLPVLSGSMGTFPTAPVCGPGGCR